MSMLTPSQHIWIAAGKPAHPYKDEPCDAVCATCAVPIATGVPLKEIETPTTSNHADIFRYGCGYVCPACAWLFAAGKGRPGNFIATPYKMEYTVISVESVVDDKRPWMAVLNEIAAMPPDTPVACVMTTDVKPRLWPRVRLATVDRFGLYLHAPDYDVSEWREFSLAACLDLIGKMLPMLVAGYSKASLYHGLLRDHARTNRDPVLALEWEATLAPHRSHNHFLPALIAAGVPKGEKKNVKSTRPAENTQPATTGGNQPDQAQLGLF